MEVEYINNPLVLKYHSFFFKFVVRYNPLLLASARGLGGDQD